MRKTTSTTMQTHKLAAFLAGRILNLKTKKQNAVIVAFIGDLGSGKTVFVQGFAKALGIKEKITSPTFVILKRFKIYDLRFKNLIHIDAYRIENPKEILDLGWEDLAGDPKNIILIEWAEKIKKILPKEYFLVKFKHINEKQRAIDISFVKVASII
jgi:tRNA threonylcarbamoyladenosine biosynthesis protein TsaE